MAITEFESEDIFGDLNRKFANVSLEQSSTENLYKEITLDDLYEYRDTLLNSTYYQSCHSALKNIRKYLTQEITISRIQTVFDLDIIDRIVEILNSSGNDDLKYEAAWTVTNLAFGTKEHTAYLIRSGVIHALIYSFKTTNNFRIKSQSAWALANISIDSIYYRENMVKENIIGDVAQALSTKCEIIYNKLSSAVIQGQIQKDEFIICQSKSDSDDIKDLTWSLANICRGGFKTAEYWEQYLYAFEAFSKCIFFDNVNIWTEACWGLSRILSNMYNIEPFFQHLNLNSKVCPRLVNLIKTQAAKNLLPVLQTISNFSSGPNHYIEILLESDLLNNLWWYMSEDTHCQLRRNAILTVSNLAAGNEKIVSQVVFNENIMESVIIHIIIPGHKFLEDENEWIPTSKSLRVKTKEEWKILKESLWVLSNIFALANDESICYILRKYSQIIWLLSSILFFPQLPVSICLRLLEVLISIVDRTNTISELMTVNQKNPYAEEMLREGVLSCLSNHCAENDSEDLIEQSELLYAAITSSTSQQRISDLAGAFGLSQNVKLPGINVRRIVHGFEDGDIRFIENAINNIQI